MSAGASMYDLRGWKRISCAERDEHYSIAASALIPTSALTDTDGVYGTPVIYTEWARNDSDEPLLRDYRYPTDPTTRACEHYFFIGAKA